MYTKCDGATLFCKASKAAFPFKAPAQMSPQWDRRPPVVHRQDDLSSVRALLGFWHFLKLRRLRRWDKTKKRRQEETPREASWPPRSEVAVGSGGGNNGIDQSGRASFVSARSPEVWAEVADWWTQLPGACESGRSRWIEMKAFQPHLPVQHQPKLRAWELPKINQGHWC